jgi:MiaB-like tRNA modifying enzyme
MPVKSLKPVLIESIPFLNRSPRTAQKPKVWIEAYGCSASMSDSEMIAGSLREAGYERALTEDEGSLSVIVTCSVKDTSEHRMLSRIRSLTKSGRPLVVAGCLPKADRATVERLSPSSSLVGPLSIDRIAGVANSALAGERRVELEDSGSDKLNIPRIRLNPAVGIVQIASGCLSECTFCQTKLAKGMLRSYRVGDIVRQVKSEVEAGCKEVWLTSTDSGCYGMDIGSDLVELLSACCTVPGDFKIRLGMMNPMYLPRMLDRLVDTFMQNDKLFKFVHIPVESGSDRVLRLMKRGHTSKTFLQAVKEFRSKIPEMTVSTDIIVGFPTETETDFGRTIKLIDETQPDIVNISRYGARPGTEAAMWKKGRISSQTAKQRSERLHSVAKEIAKSRNAKWKNWEGDVTIDEIMKGQVQGRNYAYKSVMLHGARGLALGDRRYAKVHDFSSFSLRATIIP